MSQGTINRGLALVIGVGYLALIGAILARAIQIERARRRPMGNRRLAFPGRST